MARITLLLQLLACVALSFALDITGKIAWNDVCRNAKTLGHTKASLNEGVFSGGITHEGDFIIPDVPEGTYILSITSHDFAFDQLRIDVTNSSSFPDIRPYIAGTPMNPPSSVLLSYPISLSPREKSVYFVPPESFNLAGMLSNPMMLLMVGGAVMMLAMPYLMKNMDPEALQEFKEQQGKMGQIQSAFQSGDIKAGFSSIMAAADEQSGPTAATPPSRGGGPTKRGNKKSKR
ncbi:hypothetical protein GALMADRAFT_233834 [Galerina marginata CBS 339.88]|uniref:ER membrane protein complex subunit 7 beta-sandwich domain-containing protein n=1 Tax=Galerina marginata (strain CBS 339.88) TaxID=685588 RepID=A0A067TPM8_GALM3|nr:hypothetical protein GALMADRAFT_233834 [Galerina marginata CBS 339.88]